MYKKLITSLLLLVTTVVLPQVGSVTISVFDEFSKKPLSANGSADLRSPEKEVYFRSWDLANLLVVRSPRSGAHKKRM
ncbi:MAG: hypothetical protein ACK40Y_09975 [Cloacibacterium caeni]